ncbi:MAG TPA: rhomboid family intramembrane serine protease [Terracidiphilus sp.]|nr:rhomboid family intramembrane serine protease [Terracidiphilus sp.]
MQQRRCTTCAEELLYDDKVGSYPPTPHEPGTVHVNGQASQPEVLPPAGGYTVQRRRVSRWPTWASSPATYILVGINCAVYLAMIAKGVSPTEPTIRQLMFWGADNADAVLIAGQWWRIVTAMFVHVGFLHLALNMWCLWNLALLAEPLMGPTGVIAVYILTGAAGNLLSTLYNWFHPMQDSGGISFAVGAGASGAVFGIAGALIVLLKSTRLPVPPIELSKLRKSVIYFAAINLVLGFGISFGASMTQSGVRIDNMAHLGGFTSGLLFAMPMVPRLGSLRQVFQSRLRVAILMLAGILVLFGFYLSRVAG